MIRYAHFVKSNFFGIFKKTIWSPDAVEKIDKIVFENQIVISYLRNQSTSNILYSSLIFSGNRKRGSRHVCARKMSVT